MNEVIIEPRFPKILQLSASGEPIKWITYEDYATLKSKDRIAWTTGKYVSTIHGGINAATGLRSFLEMDTVIAVKHEKKANSKKRHHVDYNPALTNTALFQRDQYLCAYCTTVYPRHKLTRDHIHPLSRGGKDIWINVVTACSSCNNYKGDKLLEEIDLKLAYIPYTPSFYEHLILENRHILDDQLTFLIKGVNENSPVYKAYKERIAA